MYPKLLEHAFLTEFGPQARRLGLQQRKEELVINSFLFLTTFVHRFWLTP
jgi:hypothetical protein